MNINTPRNGQPTRNRQNPRNNLPRLNQEEIENLKRPITRDKIESVIKKKKIPTNESPGPDGFKDEIYQIFRRVNAYPSQKYSQKLQWKEYFWTHSIKPSSS